MGWLTKFLLGLFEDVIQGIVDFLGEIVNGIFDMIVDANNAVDTSGVTKYTAALAIALLGIYFVKKMIDVYGLQTDGDPDSDPILYVEKCVFIVAIISCNNWIFKQLLRMSKLVTSDISSSVGKSSISKHTTALVDDVMVLADVSGTGYVLVFLLVILITMIAVIIFTVVASIRGAELILMKCLIPLFALDMLTTNRERWNKFFTAYMVTFFGYAIQVFAYRMFCQQYLVMTVDASSIQAYVVFGWAILMIRSPKWLTDFVYTSGVGSAIGRGAQTAVFLLRR